MYNQYIKRKTKRGNTMANYDISKMEDLTVTLTLDDDTELECAVITIFEADGHDYIALLPLEGEDFEDGSVYLYRYTEVDGEPELQNIETDEEYDIVSDAFDEWLDTQEYDEIVDEEDLEDDFEDDFDQE